MNISARKKSLSTGERGEKTASTYLKEAGYLILATNFCNKSGRRIGEIDIIAKDNDEIVFVEVKTRTLSIHNVPPEESITKSKLYKLNKAATFYINKNKLYNSSYRFDAISIVVNKDGSSANLRHIKNIFL